MSAQASLLSKYGIPDAAYQMKFCEVWEVTKDFPELSAVINSLTKQPLKRALVNRDFKAKLFKAFTMLRAAGLLGEIKTWDGALNQREVRGKNSTSTHAWAASVDLNAEIEKMTESRGRTTKWSKEFIKIMLDAGLFWGGNFKPPRFDPMHFALFNG